MTESHWEELDHTADIAIRVWGDDLTALFNHAAEATLTLMGKRLDPPGKAFTRKIDLCADDSETLLIDWLTEFLILAEGGAAVEQVEITHIDTYTLTATLKGHTGAYFSSHIKAATYTGLNIEETKRGLETRIVYDV